MSESNLATEYDIDRLRNDLASLESLITGEMAYIKSGINEVNDEVQIVKNDIQGVKDDIYTFKVRFEEFVDDLEKKNNITHAQGRIVILNQEIEKQFGLYEDVRNNLVGILQAVDTGLVSKKVITNSTEELMLGTPKYWLSPSLIAIAAWINNNYDLANRAINEGLKRNAIKTELIFTLISNRLKRQDAGFAWLSKFFETQDPLAMPQETLVLVNAYTDGVFGPDSQGVCMQQIRKWMNYLSRQPEIVKDLEERWIKKIKVMQNDEIETIPFQYLEQYSPNFAVLMNLLNYARKHEILLNYLKKIIDSTKEKKDYVEELDNILFKLVNEYDEDEFELRKEHKLCELIIKYKGDKEAAEADFDANIVTLFKNKVTFFEILVNAVTQDKSSPNLKKLAILLMKEWLINAHRDFTAQYRMQYLTTIDITMDNWTDSTSDGSNVKELSDSYKKYLKKILDKDLKRIKPSVWVIAVVIICLLWLISSTSSASITAFIISFIIMAWNITQVVKKKQDLKNAFEKKCYDGASIINAFCAEFVDWQKEYKEADAKSEDVSNFLNNYSTSEFSNNSAASKILINNDTEV